MPQDLTILGRKIGRFDDFDEVDWAVHIFTNFYPLEGLGLFACTYIEVDFLKGWLILYVGEDEVRRVDLVDLLKDAPHADG